ncbi:MAG TPA: alpha/beta hydrolase-fold protein [Gaiellaceae bacterium]|nr:alpha/beta hydrolase-fold protein [Gaiellaceae bacterium]
MPLLAALVSAALLPGFVPFAAGPHGGTVLEGTFPQSFRAGYVYLPPGYSRSERYPVVYLLHGMPGSPSEYLAGTDLVDFADDAISSGRVRPFVAVMPAAGTRAKYNGEWAGQWERELVEGVLPFVDAHVSTIAAPDGRVLAGLSAGGFGAVYIALRHPRLFGTVESWSGYFHPLRDGPFRHDTKAALAGNDPRAIAQRERGAVDHERFFLASGPFHSHWFRPAETWAFARTLRGLGVHVRTYYYGVKRGEWKAQLAAGLIWALHGQ